VADAGRAPAPARRLRLARVLRPAIIVLNALDNGFSCGYHGFWGKDDGTVPWDMYENSVRVPAIFCRPGRNTADRVENALVSACDFLPALLEYLELSAPSDFFRG